MITDTTSAGWNGVDTSRVPGRAAQQSPRGERAALQQAVDLVLQNGLGLSSLEGNPVDSSTLLTVPPPPTPGTPTPTTAAQTVYAGTYQWQYWSLPQIAGFGADGFVNWTFEYGDNAGCATNPVTIAAFTAVPLLVKVAMERINRPESERGSRNRLRSIRDDSGFRSDTDAL